VRVDTYRLAAHSKGDDDRDPREIESHSRLDPLNAYLAGQPAADDPAFVAIRRRITQAVSRAEQGTSLGFAELARVRANGSDVAAAPTAPEADTQLERINRALRAWLEEDPSVVLLGEDIRSPYGGAFKVTRGLSDEFPERVINTPISEAGIVGIGNGLALGGRRPIVEIMFGDFLGLCFDQLLNHAAKFQGMYNRRVTNPIVIRTPMGGGRGYGPTHSQNIEKHFAGIPGLRMLVLHGRTRITEMYRALRSVSDPTLVIENKLLYRERCDAAPPSGYTLMQTAGPFPATLLRPKASADLTVVGFGRMSTLAEQVAASLADEEEIYAELLFPLCVSPFDVRPVLESIAASGKLLVVEEGAGGFDLGSEVIAAAALAYRGNGRLHVRRVAARPIPIPSAMALENEVLPNVAALRAACLELFDE
jgi:2-oxoisovalerate dehydrogenase E1 component